MVFAREEKGVEGGVLGLLIAKVSWEMGKGLRLRARRDRRPGRFPCGRGRPCPRWPVTCGAGRQRERRTGLIPFRNEGDVGPGLAFGTGPNRIPAALSHFLISFSFSYFLFSFNSLANLI
jgi:hypothetical protein